MGKRNRNFNLVAVGMLLCAEACVGLAVPANATNGWDIDLKDYAYDLGESSISISIGGANSEILNADKGVAQGMIKQTASVELGATNGYTVKVSGAPNLTGVNTKATIPSAALTLGNMVNQWGWYAVNGVVDCSASSVYKIMSTDGTQIDGGVLADGGTKTYTMCFGMRVNGEQAADTYSGSVTVSVVAEPGMIKTAPFSGITYMQDMTANICKLADENETAQLIDRRDNKKYWVTKLLDGNCWMSQNLDLNITTSNITTATSDVTTNWASSSTYPPQTTATTLATGSTTNAGTYSWDLGQYVINAPTGTTECTSNNTGLGSCTMFTAVGSRTASTDPNFYRKSTYTGTDGTTSCTKTANTSVSTATSGVCAQYDAHYTVGNYYQWNAATAGTGGTISNYATATGSICPKGWKLPNSGTDQLQKGSFNYMLLQYGLANENGAQYSGNTGTSGVNGNTYDVALSPLFGVRAGDVYPSTGMRFYKAGTDGYLWSARAVYDDTLAYELHFDSSSIDPSDYKTLYYDGYPRTYHTRYFGLSVRCLFNTF